ncbi:MAG: ferrous iron transport protein B [Gemmatimonadetes bacterium]|nr:ferrous iron transport protein B [Gemmatimonadota bacterium]
MDIADRERPYVGRATVAVVGNPNTGKTTLFNALTGLSQRVGNFPGVTVERKVGQLTLPNAGAVDLLDLPGTYSLSAKSPDEFIAVEALMGLLESESTIQAVLVVLDASNLRRSLYVVSQLLEIDLPLVVALNMLDVAKARGIVIDAPALSERLGVPVIPIQANKRVGLDELKEALSRVVEKGRVPSRSPISPQSWWVEADQLAQKYEGVSTGLVLRVLIDNQNAFASHVVERFGDDFAADLHVLRAQVNVDDALANREIELRYRWIDGALDDVLRDPEPLRVTRSDRLDRFLTHPLWGSLSFAVVMAFVFQSIFSWAVPLMDGIDALFGAVGGWASGYLPEGALQSMVVDGVIAGVGGVVIFLPQICILFLFIAILEDCGYMARAALLMDRLLTPCGLSGKSFIPLLSSFACAIPGVMATRTINDPKDRIATMLVAPLMSCSARLPVYAIFIGAFIPNQNIWGGIGLQGLTLFALYCVGIFVAIPVAWILKKTLLRGQPTPFLLELPSYKIPDVGTVGMRIYQSARHFLERAGTLILAATIVMWALAYFPRSETIAAHYEAERERLVGASEEILDDLRAKEAGEMLKQSFLGRMGHAVEPVVEPLGWDWRIGMAALASFPAREVIVAVLGTIYSLGEVDEESASLRDALRSATWSDGRKVFNIPVALSIMVFFALCAQCVSTLAVIQRETGAWRWPVLTFVYMTVLAYIGAFVTYRLGMALGWG